MPNTAPCLSRLTVKFQATVPAPVREKLGLKSGDSVAFIMEKNRVTLRKATALDLNYLAALGQTLEEWNSPADIEAYRGL